MKSVILFAGVLACTSLRAETVSPADEIASRSGLPASEVAALLENCDANQTSMNFCAWRDRLVAEQNLHLVVLRKEAESPACRVRLEKQVSKWTRQRDRVCGSQSRREWGDGSMRQAAQATCVTKETERLIEKVSAFHCR
ncbi:lysozyme inhibitor LprI family protein [Paraburkholderia terrae]|uniref:lysozyme inhibitor LprI family protein n=1 Tax=Paraburkholderia terrae TaxID=311230 RepID=UPI00296AAF95|nr:lysozyme inhibitor LprI family protein [Paraburkholderia terrae]MDW3655656.1 lysozyme inhibitor LprI family protein [Paraburkholderia terrae]